MRDNVYQIMFNGRNILSGFPDDLVKVVNFLNEKASSGEFTFFDSFIEWADNEDIIEPLGLNLDGENYYYAVSLAYLAYINDGHLVIPSDVNAWRLAWSLQLLAEVANWEAIFIERVIRSFIGLRDDIHGLLGAAAQIYAKKNFEKGLELSGVLKEFGSYISAGMMENNFHRYCEMFLPVENQELFTSAYCMAFELSNEAHEQAFDIAMTFDSFKSAEAMAFLLKEHMVLEGNKRDGCGESIKNLLRNGGASEYVTAVTNWIFRGKDEEQFVEEVVNLLIEGLGVNGRNYLGAIDNAVSLRYKDVIFLTRILLKVAESLSPADILKMDHCLHRLNDKRDDFVELIALFIVHPKGEYRLVGRRLWDEYHMESTDFKVSDLDEMGQCAFTYSMLQDFGNPETRLPKILPLLKTGNKKVRKFVMGILRPYTDDYMGHVVAACDKLKMKGKEVKTIKDYVDGRWKVIQKRKELKELSPVYTYGKEFREARRIEIEYLQNKMKEAEESHHSVWKEFASTVILARGGGWRMPDGTTQKLPLIQFSAPARQLSESLSPREYEDWLKELLRDWNDTTRNN